MRRTTRVLAVLLATLPLLPMPINFVQNSFGANKTDQVEGEVVDEGNGVLATKVQTPEGLLTVNLPSDLSRSDTISGTVIADAAGQTPEEQKQHTDEIGGYVVEIEKAEPTPEEPPQTVATLPQQPELPEPNCSPTPETKKKKEHPPKKKKEPLTSCTNNPPPFNPPPATSCNYNPPPTISCSYNPPPTKKGHHKSGPLVGNPPPMSCNPPPTTSCNYTQPPTTNCTTHTPKSQKPPRTNSCTNQPPTTATKPTKKTHTPGVVKATPKNPGFTCSLPKNSNGINVVVKNKNGQVVSRTPIPVNPKPPGDDCPPGTAMLPSVGTAGRPVRIKAPTSGNTKTGVVKIGGKPCTPVVKSPRGVVVNTPEGVTGASKIEFTEGNMTATGPFTNLAVHASCSKTVLDKGQSSTIVINVTGTEGMKSPVTLRITNTAPSVVSLSGGDRQTFKINPGQ